MSFTPYPHQDEMIAEARAASLEHGAVIIRSPTGSGKTVIGAVMAHNVVQKGLRVMFTVHRDFLVGQTAETFQDVGLQAYGIIAAGVTPNLRARAQIAAIDTLKNRLDKVPVPNLLIVDECHHSVAAGWAKVIAFYKSKGTVIVGLSATPIRLDGRGLAEHYDHMVQGPSVRWLIDNGFLCDYEAYIPSTVDLSSVHTRMGDFVKAEAEAEVDKPTITGDAIREYKRLAPGKRAVVFCISVAHSLHVRAQFEASGIPAAHIDGTTPKDERKSILAAFRRGDIQVLTSVEIFGEGFDLPAVEVAILLRPTQSLSLHLQQIGRALRMSAGKERAIILDHVGNLMRLGLPDGDFEWTLEGRKKKKKKDGEQVMVKQCESCFRAFWPPPTCPYCGHTHVVVGRAIEEVDGELTKLTPEMIAAAKKQKRMEVGKARTLEELQDIGKARGYKDTWALNIWQVKETAAQRRVEAQAQAYGRFL
ncbi:DEAD/DEAH box helicase [Phenylobacterium ferrooxidans]|uniref:DEAD/DEAH box helicase n=1 Tax=Phenylobacterium ferrooxidans TaxID=2982689 RepID=A0ABW6CJ91_9CAUL